MEELTELATNAHRQILAEKQQAKREGQAGVLQEGLQRTIAMLVLLGAHWDCIRAVVTVKTARLKVASGDGSKLTDADIQELAKDICERKPAFANTADNSEDAFQLKTCKVWRQWRTTQWLFLQNLKGIAMPPSLVMQHYRSLWGHGPHGPRVTKHMDEFKAKNYRRQWMARLRKLWGFKYSKLPASAPMTEEVKRQKAARDRLGAMPAQHHATCRGELRGPSFGTRLSSRFGDRHISCLLENKHIGGEPVPKLGTQFGSNFRDHVGIKSGTERE